VLVEAMGIGVPVVSTNVTGIPELVEDGRTGLVVPEHDPAALAEAIGRIVGDQAQAAALAGAGRKRIEERFDLRRNVAELRALLEEARS
jgi:glycosyltransferase involved in cell wall biosynthesis